MSRRDGLPCGCDTVALQQEDVARLAVQEGGGVDPPLEV